MEPDGMLFLQLLRYPMFLIPQRSVKNQKLDDTEKTWENFRAFTGNIPDVIRTHDLPLRRDQA